MFGNGSQNASLNLFQDYVRIPEGKLKGDCEVRLLSKCLDKVLYVVENTYVYLESKIY